MVTQPIEGDTITAFTGRKEIGFPKEIEKPRLAQRRGAARPPPKHWPQDQVKDQEERDVVLHSRAPGTWASYNVMRWWQLFVTFVKRKGESTSDWKTSSLSSAGDRMAMVMMLRNMVVSMRQKKCIIMDPSMIMLVTAVTSAARDFGWASPREDKRFAAVMEGLRCIKGQGGGCQEEAGYDC